jgi:recombination protein RecA
MKESERRRSILQRLARMESAPTQSPAISTGFRALDDVLGGGLPRGSIVEWFGPAGSGKTTLAIQTIAHLQQTGMSAAWIDADHTFSPDYASALGLATEDFPVAQPQSAEEALEIARTLAASGAVDLIVIDSAAALTPRLEVEAGIGESGPGLQSRVLGRELQKLSVAVRRGTGCVLFLNQMRNRTGGGGETSAGGPPLKLFAAIRLALLPAAGSRVRLRTLKNKAAEGVGAGEMERRKDSGFMESP